MKKNYNIYCINDYFTQHNGTTENSTDSRAYPTGRTRLNNNKINDILIPSPTLFSFL